MSSQRVRLAYLFPRLEWCGPLKGILATIKNLPPHRYQPFLITLSPPKHPDVLAACRDLGCTHIQLTQRSFLDLRLARQLANLIRQQDIAILHTSVLRPDWHGALARRINQDFVLVSTLRAEDDKLLLRNRGLTRFLIAHTINLILFRRFDHVVALSNSTRSYARRLLVPSSKITLIRNAVDTEPFLHIDRQEAKTRILADFQLPPSTTLVGMIATFWPYKDHHSFFALADSFRKDTSIVFLDVGDGPQLNAFRQKAASAALSSLLYPGFLSPITTIQGALDVHVFLSHTEGLPRAVMESMAAGTPVLAWDSPGVGECIRHMETGILVPKGDLGLLRKRLRELLASPELRTHLTRNARRAVLREYSASRMAVEHHQLYTKLLQAKR